MRKTVTAVVRASEWLAALGVLVCIAVNLAQVTSRYFLFAPLAWSEEVMRYAMVWVAMLGATAAIGRGELPAVNMLSESGNKTVKRLFSIAAAFCVCVMCVTLILAGGPTLARASAAVSPAAEIPLSIPYLAVFVGFGLMALLTIALLFLKQPVGGDVTDG